ncbi:glutamine amidotransferase [Paraburkholderia sp. D15]|uniref:glutamine amidotransferase n=1 Tax=Paraburkholderia sp. D15 TaxID=2880218 RepID=UPI002478B2E3|nr:glutamine amidotransferase [Paraburkholderia sp. D15]WGS51610.1 glutamine amidotransferase [Paraburkholderia sp. D15]
MSNRLPASNETSHDTSNDVQNEVPNDVPNEAQFSAPGAASLLASPHATVLAPRDAPARILIVLHREQSSPGRVGRLLQQRGYELDIRRPPLGDPLPTSMRDHAGAVIFGGPMSANDSDAWIRTETDWIGVPLREQAPFLGICLGAQMMIRHLGGKVSAHRDGIAEIGYWPIKPTLSGRALCQWPERVYQWHREGFESVTGLERLAVGEQFENQAVRYGPAAFGVQFHPEVSYQMMRRWSAAAAHKLGAPGAQDIPAQTREGHRHDRAGVVWLNSFLDRWLSLGMAGSVGSVGSVRSNGSVGGETRGHIADAQQPPLDRLEHRLVTT